MTGYKSFNIRSAAVAAVCTVLFSTTLVLSAVGPVHATDSKTTSVSVVRPLA
jgi:hypothetical protein